MINKINNIIKKYNLDGYIVAKNDEYFTEYSEINKLQVLCNFTGSAGFALILKKSKHLFVDGRYTIQAKRQSGKKFKIEEIPYTWPKDILKKRKNITIGFDPKFFTSSTLLKYFDDDICLKPVNENLLKINNFKLKKNRYIYKIDNKITGESHYNKIRRVINLLKKEKVENLFISSGENVCWLLNIRGKDLPNSPIVNSRAVITSKGKIYLFVDTRKVTKNFTKKFNNKNIFIYDENQIFKVIKKIKTKKFAIDNLTCSIFYESLIKSSFKIISKIDPIYDLKSVKNKTELKNMKKAHIEDGVALTKFLYWIKHSNIKNLDEIKVQKKLDFFRKKNKNYLYPSFETISGSGSNGAIIHYRSTKNSNKKLNHKELLLVDSGGQYKWGTTDVTRTICFSKLNDKIKELYTRVLKGHIAVANAKINNLKYGHNIDKVARKSLNSVNLDYRHGTGHGVGFFMNVHEGPQSISKNNFVKLRKGMVVSNEPGYYHENNFGIRIENLVYIDSIEKNLIFKNLTFVPLEKDLIKINMLSKTEKDYLFNYCLETYYKLSPYLKENEKKWLARLI